jgi:predicted phosphohydrolase
MKKIETDSITIEIKEIHEHGLDMCDKICSREDICKPCYYRRDFAVPQKPILNTRIVFIISNLTKEEYWISDGQFNLIDSDGFSHEGKYFCDKYSLLDNSKSNSCNIPPYSKIRFQVIFSGIDKNHKTSKISYKKERITYFLFVDEDEITDTEMLRNISFSSQIKQLEEENGNLKSKLKELQYEYDNLKHGVLIDEGGKKTRISDSLIKYVTKQDDEYFYVISDEQGVTISFNREFDKSKGNYNWINEGDALITMKIDNAEFWMSCPTKIESPVSGIFEFEKNKLIQYGEVICRIKLYEQSRKQEIIEKLEEEDIKDAVYKKERKKKIEREALDELISKGLVFNSYVTKEGNRSTIPIDVANAVWNRDGGKCVYCGSKDKLEFDHIIPVSKGGSNTYRNLQLLCENCNREKSDKIG